MAVEKEQQQHTDLKKLASFKRTLITVREIMKESDQVGPKITEERFGQLLNNRDNSSSAPLSSASALTSSSSQPKRNVEKKKKSNKNSTALSWIYSERVSLTWIIACASLGALLGFAIGAGWLTRGAGSYQLSNTKRVLGAMSQKKAFTRKKAIVRFVVSVWRANLAKRVRKTFLYAYFKLMFQLITFNKDEWKIVTKIICEDLWGAWWPLGKDAATNAASGSGNENWIAVSPLWPPNWILFRDLDMSQVDVGTGGLSPLMVSTLSFILPWRRSLIQKLARKDRVKVMLRDDQEGHDGLPFGSHSMATPNQQINPYYHPMAFHTLREYIIRFDSGYVHPDLGFLVPAPSGAERGIGMVRDEYTKCQVHCNPGTADEKLKDKRETLAFSEESQLQAQIDADILKEMMDEIPAMESMATATDVNIVSSSSDTDTVGVTLPPLQVPKKSAAEKPPNPFLNTTTYEGIKTAVHLQLDSATSISSTYTQSEVLLRIPLEAQITRKAALDTLLGLLSPEQNGKAIEDLDDAFLLAVYLAHERGLGTNSRIWPYIATLPLRPTCALHWGWQQSVVDVITAMSVEMGTDVQGWPHEISKAAEYSERIVLTLSRAFGETLAKQANGPDVTANIRWSLCQVASRAVAGREEHGSLRLIPMMDMINHDLNAGKFVELTGKEKLEDGHFLDADENHAGTFVVRSQRHGERKRLRKGQELMANYNVPMYSPLDWFINMGYIPPERAGKWTMLEAGLPRSYRGGFQRSNSGSIMKDGAFGSTKPEIQVIRQHTQQHQTASGTCSK